MRRRGNSFLKIAVRTSLFGFIFSPFTFFPLVGKGFVSKCPQRVEVIILDYYQKWLLQKNTTDANVMKDIIFSSEGSLAIMHDIIRQSFKLQFTYNNQILQSVSLYRKWLTDVVDIPLLGVLFFSKISKSPSVFFLLEFPSASVYERPRRWHCETPKEAF